MEPLRGEHAPVWNHNRVSLAVSGIGACLRWGRFLATTHSVSELSPITAFLINRISLGQKFCGLNYVPVVTRFLSFWRFLLPLISCKFLFILLAFLGDSTCPYPYPISYLPIPFSSSIFPYSSLHLPSMTISFPLPSENQANLLMPFFLSNLLVCVQNTSGILWIIYIYE